MEYDKYINNNIRVPRQVKLLTRHLLVRLTTGPSLLISHLGC